MTLDFVSRLRLSGGWRSYARMAAPWLVLILLNALVSVPAMLLKVLDRPLLLVRPSGELLALLTIAIASDRLALGRWVRRVALVLGFVLWIYMWDELVGKAILHQTPLLYDQLFLIEHLGVLISDLWSWQLALGLLAAVAIVGAIVWLFVRLFRRLSRSLAATGLRRTLPIAVGIWALVIAATFMGKKDESWVYWVTPSLADNVAASFAMHDEIKRGVGESPYAHYATDIELERKPDIQLFLVESYGRLLAADRNTRQEWKANVEEIDATLRAKGWHSVTGFSAAPVSGGRSWLAEATLLTGIHVKYEAVYRSLIKEMHETPNLVSFLESQGYRTILLAPKDRELRGFKLENHYAYDQMICRDDLEYTGRKLGWGEIPDQYSLGFADDRAFSQVEGPLFFNFHMVSSHAPWKVVPEVMDDWQNLNGRRRRLRAATAGGERGLGSFKTRMARYRRVEPRFNYMGEVDSLKIGSYAKSIYYDLRVIANYLGAQTGREKLVIITGDHQPPLISTDDESYDVPMHVLATDPALLEEFRAIGFSDGLYADPEALPTMGHETLFSLMIRNLVRCCAKPGTPLPEIDFDGVRIGSPREW